MKIQRLIDAANKTSEEYGRYLIRFALAPQRLNFQHYLIPNLSWSSIMYGEEELDKVPNDKRGIYAFAIHQPSVTLPPHKYILYIGISGRNSNRSLRERYRDYLTMSKVQGRPSISYMIGNWHPVLQFLYAPVEDEVTTEELQELEKQLNSALMPPYSYGDIDAEIRHQRKAFP